jgi:hypothetical protein
MQNQFTKIKYDSRTNVENMQMKTQRLKHYFLLKQKTKKSFIRTGNGCTSIHSCSGEPL